MADTVQFNTALRNARLAEAARLEAMINLQDARVLRLMNLADAVKAKLEGHVQAQSMFELSVQFEARPKLWIDLVSAVVMEPDPRHYRLVQEREASKETLFETDNRSEMEAYLIRYMAHRFVGRERAVLDLEAAPVSQNVGYALRDMIYVWITGCIFGIMALLSIAMYMGKLSF